MKQEIENLIATILSQLDLSDIHPTVTVTDDPAYGDYATNVAFQAAKKLGKTPMEAAEIIRNALSAKRYALIEKIEVAQPGFINFTLSQRALVDSLLQQSYSSNEVRSSQASSSHSPQGTTSCEGCIRTISPMFEGKKIMVEFTDPNPFKELHIGHLYSNIVGESISRLLEANGAEVRRVCYQGDVGLHVAKALYGLRRKMSEEGITINDLERRELGERAQFLGESYALGATEFEESETAKQEIIAINKQVYQKDPEVMEMYTKGRQWSLDYFQSVYERLGTNFTKLYFESDAGPIGLQLVKDHPEVFTESQGAIVFSGEEYGLHTRVFVNSLGLPTYEAKELGLAVTKYNDYPFDQSIMITGNEINEYFKVLLKALSVIRPEIAAKMKHISHGIVRLPEGKMSSRTGKIIRAEWLLDEAVVRAGVLAKGKGHHKGTSFSEAAQSGENEENAMRLPLAAKQDLEEISEMVGVGAVKWALLKSGIGKDIEFSFDESVSFEGNSGPYIQYTYVRTQSLLAKSKEYPKGTSFSEAAQSAKRGDQDSTPMPYALGAMLNSEERSLLVLLCQYSDIVASAAEKYAPSTLATYLFNLAQAFNNFYQKYPIIKEEEGVRELRLALTSKVGQTIKDGLYLLGIQSPERM